MKLPNSTLNRGTKQLSRAKAGNLKRCNLKRGRPLRAKKWPKWKKHTKHAWLAMLDFLYHRAEGKCERCHRLVYQKDISPANVHHIQARSHCGTDDPSNLAFLCSPMQFYGKTDSSCHTWCHSNPKAARTEGWLK